MARDQPFRTAEKKIEEAGRSGAQKLDLSGLELTAFPQSLGQLTQLQLLDLSKNKLTVLPEALGQLTHLRSLDVSNNQLTVLPEALGQLTQLRSLVLIRSRLTALPEWLAGRDTSLSGEGLSRPCHNAPRDGGVLQRKASSSFCSPDGATRMLHFFGRPLHMIAAHRVVTRGQ